MLQAIDDFKSKLDDGTTRGAVFFAVCRGKVRTAKLCLCLKSGY